MSTPPAPVDELIARHGPHLAYQPPGGWQAPSRAVSEQLVKTHCCFCGQQCGIQLRVQENRVVGFEPWEEFPFTLSWMPHCWPQKQQWVFTSRSGGWRACSS